MALTRARLFSLSAARPWVGGLALALAVVQAQACVTGCSPAGSIGTSAAEPAASVARPSPSQAKPPGAGSASAAGASRAVGGTAPDRAGSPGASSGPDASPAVSPAADGAAPRPIAIDADEAEVIVFPTEASRGAPEVIACRAARAAADRVHCLLNLRFRDDRAARDLAVELYDRAGHVVGLEPAQTMDGGYRGMLRLVPEAPVGANLRHLTWMAGASRDFDEFLAGITAAAPRPVRYRMRPLALRYFRSVNARTPSAYAYSWTVAYNVAGSLHVSADAVRETMFHEIFHLNDSARAGWSSSALGGLYADIIRRCGTKIPCLRPYAPHDTVVRGGTYYAFQPGNGVGEYAAELAVRYYREQRAALRKAAFGKPAFKCGPPENARAWSLFVDEFFGGADLVPPCPAR